MNKKGKTLESHKLWRELTGLCAPEDANKVLKEVVEKKFTIEEAVQVRQIATRGSCF